MIPHLIHVGYPKTGSNALRRWFAGHPQIAFADGGLGGYRSVYEVAQRAAETGQAPRCRVTSAESLALPHVHVGRPALDYGDFDGAQMALAQERACAELKSLFPEATILIVTRGYAAMLFSSYSQYARTGGLLDFDDHSASLAEAAQVWDYSRLADLYERAFGAASVILLPHEWLRDDPAGFIAFLERRLGLDPIGPPLDPVNASLSPAAMAWYPRVGRRLRSLPGGRGAHRLFVRLARRRGLERAAALAQRLRPLPLPYEEAVRAELRVRFAGAAERLRAIPAYTPYLTDYGLAAEGPAGRASEAPGD